MRHSVIHHHRSNLLRRPLSILLMLLGMALQNTGWAQLASQSIPANQPLLKRVFCVFDPVGANGPLFAIAKSFQPISMQEGVALEMRAYTDEKVASEDFKAGQCDSVLLTGTRAREYNAFTGTLEAMGAIPSEAEMRLLFNTLAAPNATPFLVNGDYEVAGIFPAGAVYLFARDRSIDTVEELQGRKIATLDYDQASLTMVRRVGASVVGANAANFAGKFNNGSVDIAYAPAVAYTPLELYKGVGTQGGVFRFAIAYMNFQVVIHRNRFPEGSGLKVRQHATSRIEEAYDLIRAAEAEIPKDHWILPTAAQEKAYSQLLQEVRLSLRDAGVYDARALKLMRAIRCKVNPEHAECAQQLE